MRHIVQKGSVSYSETFKGELSKIRMTMLDVENVLRCGCVLEEGQLESGICRYKVETDRMGIVVTFLSKTEMQLLKAWRK
ncbi:hypothetical protein F0U61_53560 [Archangium violaceum]|uniref:hypothetical protein n=1 Tax=Archangium violaceum TaxID=83451 RepID=UPI002B2A4396|nr:hypothetical protein F0U61_53560 [Archangium violaceum]